MGIFNGGSFPTSGGTVILTQEDYQTISFLNGILTISGSNSSVGIPDTTNSSLVLNGNTLELTDSDSNVLTVDLSGLTPATPTLTQVIEANGSYGGDEIIDIQTSDEITLNATNGLRLNSPFSVMINANDGSGYMNVNALVNFLSYDSSNADGTPVKTLGVDALGNMVKFDAPTPATPTLTQVIEADGSYNGDEIFEVITTDEIYLTSGRVLIGDSDGDTYFYGDVTITNLNSGESDGTPIKTVGVDAQGKLIKFDAPTPATPTLTEVLDADGSYGGDALIDIATSDEFQLIATNGIGLNSPYGVTITADNGSGYLEVNALVNFLAYSSSNADGTPVKTLGVDALGNMVKFDAPTPATPTLADVIEASDGSYNGDETFEIVTSDEIYLTSGSVLIGDSGGLTVFYGDVTINSLSSGESDGTPVKTLGVDAAGNIVKFDAASGGGSIDGTGVANRIAFWDDVDTLTQAEWLTIDSSSNSLVVGTTSIATEHTFQFGKNNLFIFTGDDVVNNVFTSSGSYDNEDLAIDIGDVDGEVGSCGVRIEQYSGTGATRIYGETFLAGGSDSVHFGTGAPSSVEGFVLTTKKASIFSATTTAIYTHKYHFATGNYTMIVDYTVSTNGGGAMRTGRATAITDGTTVNFTDVVTADIGDTSDFSLSFDLETISSDKHLRLNAVTGSSAGFHSKFIINQF